MTRTRWKVLAAVGVVALLGAACGGDDDDTQAAAGTDGTEQDGGGDAGAEPSTETGAAELRAGLTALLQEHVYLAGIAVSTGVSAGLDSPAFEAAAGTLDENSVALSEAVGGVYGDEAGSAFLELWRKHIGFFVDYTKAKAGGDEAGATAAREALDGYRADFGAFLAGANPNLTQDAVAEELVPHVDTVFSAIDAVVAGEPPFAELREAAQVMPGTANVLAGAIVAQFPDQFGSESE
ncbi:MAG TPA: hypothetical protein VM618_01275 [Acidimicrobiia bacterium]|nr:hypothetical protein [Acidimicrobiia bacterium]